MENFDQITIAQSEMIKLSQLTTNVQTDAAQLLEEELQRALVVPDEQMPKNVVRMNSEVTYRDLENGRLNKKILVYPEFENILENKISVLAPVGAALIGLCVGQSIDWPLPNGKIKTFTIVSVNYPAEPGDDE